MFVPFAFWHCNSYEREREKHSRNLTSYFILPIELLKRVHRNIFFSGICIFLVQLSTVFIFVNLFALQTISISFPDTNLQNKIYSVYRNLFYSIENIKSVIYLFYIFAFIFILKWRNNLFIISFKTTNYIIIKFFTRDCAIRDLLISDVLKIILLR